MFSISIVPNHLEYLLTLLNNTINTIKDVKKNFSVSSALHVRFSVFIFAILGDFCPIFDFENGLGDWLKTGDAFENQPTLGDNFKDRTGQSMNIEGYQWIGTAENRPLQHVPGTEQGDVPQGTLTSPKFLIAASKLHFLIGGTADSSKARAELLVNDAVVRTASPGSESMAEQEWNVTQFLRQEARLRLVDNAADGHLNFDALRMDCHLDGDGRCLYDGPPLRVWYLDELEEI